MDRVEEIFLGHYNRAWERARVFWPQVNPVPLRWDLHGSCAGRAWYSADSRIQLNRAYCVAEAKEMIQDTIPHEIAHIVAWQLWRARGHGVEWKSVFQVLTGKQANRLHSMGKPEEALTRAAGRMSGKRED